MPRPPGARAGDASPWASLAPGLRRPDLAQVRARLARISVPPTPVVPAVPGVLPVAGVPRAAAVLVPLFEEDGEVRCILTKRPDTMPSHQGQVAFPGGKVEPAVDRTTRDAALREAQEEIGLDPAAVEVIAELVPAPTVSGLFVITPVVGALAARPELVPDEREVVRVFDVPLSELLMDGVHRSEWWPRDGRVFDVHFFELEGETVWGYTARLLVRLLAAIVGVPAPADILD